MMVRRELLTRDEVSSRPLMSLMLPRSLIESTAARVGTLDFQPNRVVRAIASKSTYSKEVQVGWALSLANDAYDKGYRQGTVRGQILDIWGRYIQEGDWLKLGGYRLDTGKGREVWDMFNDSRALWREVIEGAGRGDMRLVDQAYQRIEDLTMRRELMT